MNRTGYEIFYENGKAGLKDSDGAVVLPCKYDKILDYDDDGYIRVLIGDVYGTLDLDCKEVISHSLGLTHLGVFHKGTARARKDGNWGLVDEKGNSVGGFKYGLMGPHRSWGYTVTAKDGLQGRVDEQGIFTPTKESIAAVKASKFEKVGTFHNGIAPAYTKKCKWIFIDKDYERVNSYEYWSMDPILRNGIYTAAKNDHAYTAIRFDGEPIINEFYEKPLHFSMGLAVCQKLRLDKHGKPMKLSWGQPLYIYGILTEKGDYLFPMVYTVLHWNNTFKHNCWYAEDDKACYLLYPNGTRRIYLKSQASHAPLGATNIPDKEIDNYITEEQLRDILLRPKMFYTYTPKSFKEEYFIDYIREEWGGRSLQPLQFFYRDTDAPIDVRKIYRPGKIIRCGSELEVSKRLLCPAQKTRFMIAAPELFDVKSHKVRERAVNNDIPFEEFVIGRDIFFMVVDVFTYAGINQVVLLNLPYEAIKTAKQYGVRLTLKALKPLGPDLTPLKEYARQDLEAKMGMPYHGHSLLAKWVKKMYQPIGLDEEMNLVSLNKDESYLNDANNNELNSILHAMSAGHFFNDSSFFNWSEHPVKVMIGDITKLKVDAIVNAANKTLLGGGGVDGAIHRAAGKELLDECKTLGGCETGESKMTDAYKLPCKKVIHTVGPVWHDGKHNEPKLLASCYDSAMRFAEDNDLKSIAFPCISTGVYHYPHEKAAKIAIETVLKHITTGKYSGEVTFCCFKEDDAEIYRKILEDIKNSSLLQPLW